MRSEILNEAIRRCVLERCSCSNYLHMCFAVRGKKIIASGYNCVCRIYKKCGHVRSTHAEMSVLLKIRDNKPFDLLVIRTNKDGSRLLISKPCHSCSRYIHKTNFSINRIFYSNGKGGIVSMPKNNVLLSEEPVMDIKSPIFSCVLAIWKK